MRTVIIIAGVLIGIVGFRLFGAGLRTLVGILKVDDVPSKARQQLFRDLFLGVLLIILGLVLILP